jgi:hypothetical protein
VQRQRAGAEAVGGQRGADWPELEVCRREGGGVDYVVVVLVVLGVVYRFVDIDQRT